MIIPLFEILPYLYVRQENITTSILITTTIIIAPQSLKHLTVYKTALSIPTLNHSGYEITSIYASPDLVTTSRLMKTSIVFRLHLFISEDGTVKPRCLREVVHHDKELKFYSNP